MRMVTDDEDRQCLDELYDKDDPYDDTVYLWWKH